MYFRFIQNKYIFISKYVMIQNERKHSKRFAACRKINQM